jgi:murein DD-endopeptidase MepM/ murein hydrolase activator NlpD
MGYNWTLNGSSTTSLYSGGPVYAAAPGKVVLVATGDEGGRQIVIDHGCGYKTRYLHLYEVNVALNAQVDSSTRIGTEGNTGQVQGNTGCHLHLEFFVDATGGTPNRPDAGEYRTTPVAVNSRVQRGEQIPAWVISCP